VGIAFALAASFLWAVSSILVSKATERASPIMASFLSLAPGPIILLVATLVSGQTSLLLTLQPVHWLYFSLAGFFNFVLGRTLSFLAIQLIGASRASPLAGASILFGPLSAIVILREVVDLRTAAGILAVFIGIMLITGDRE